MRTLVVRRAAPADLSRADRWYEGLGEEMLEEVRSVFDRMLVLPHSFPVIHRETRRALIRRFPYGLFFRLDGDLVIVVAFLHLRRDPESWKRRR